MGRFGKLERKRQSTWVYLIGSVVIHPPAMVIGGLDSAAASESLWPIKDKGDLQLEIANAPDDPFAKSSDTMNGFYRMYRVQFTVLSEYLSGPIPN